MIFNFSLNKLLYKLSFLFFLVAFTSASHSQESSTDLYGVIEVGGSGVKASAFQVTVEEAFKAEKYFTDRKYGKNVNFKYELFKDEERKISFEERETNVLYKQNIGETVDAVKYFVEKLYKTAAVTRNHIFIVLSSGVANAKHHKELVSRIFEKTRIEVDTITAAQECSYTYRWIVPKYRYDEVVVIDIGSANTKACYAEHISSRKKRIRSFQLSKYGTKSFAKKINEVLLREKRPLKDFAKVSKEQSWTLAREFSTAREANPGLETSSRVYLVGGISWATATLVRPERLGASWVKLSTRDFVTLNNRALSRNAYRVDYRRLNRIAKNKKKKLEKIVQKIKRRVFNEEQMIAGTTFMVTMSERLNFSHKNKIYFSNIARDGWRSQYLLDKIINSNQQGEEG